MLSSIFCNNEKIRACLFYALVLIAFPFAEGFIFHAILPAYALPFAAVAAGALIRLSPVGRGRWLWPSIATALSFIAGAGVAWLL